jgi:hypothetical protein
MDVARREETLRARRLNQRGSEEFAQRAYDAALAPSLGASPPAQ